MGTQLGMQLEHLAETNRLLPVGNSTWCQQYAGTLATGREMGGAPPDLSTIEAAVRMLFALHAEFVGLGACIDELVGEPRRKQGDTDE